MEVPSSSSGSNYEFTINIQPAVSNAQGKVKKKVGKRGNEIILAEPPTKKNRTEHLSILPNEIWDQIFRLVVNSESGQKKIETSAKLRLVNRCANALCSDIIIQVLRNSCFKVNDFSLEKEFFKSFGQNIHFLSCDGESKRSIRDLNINQMIQFLPNLKRLFINNYVINYINGDGNEFTNLNKCPELESIDLSGCWYTKTNSNSSRMLNQLTNLSTLKKLRELNLNLFRRMSYLGGVFKEDSDVLMNIVSDKELIHIGGIESLESLNLKGHSLISDLGLFFLLDLKKLKSLDLSHCFKITDIGLKCIAKHKSLEHLNLSLYLSMIEQTALITDHGVSNLKELIRLRSLSLSGCHLIGNQGIAALKGLIILETLLLGHPIVINENVTNDAMVYLKELKKLKHLDLSNIINLDDEALLIIQNLAELETLGLKNCRITDEGLKLIKKLKRLEKLDLSGCRQITDNGIFQLKELPELKRLYLKDCELITDETLSYLSGFKDIEELDLSNCGGITDKGLAFLKNFPKLTKLRLENCQITDKGLSEIGSLLNLEYLDLTGCNQITDNGILHLKDLQKLKKLKLKGCRKVTDDGVYHIKQITSLERLNLDSCLNMTDTALLYLSELTNLKSLDLGNCLNITDKGLFYLQKLVNIESLSLDGCDKITPGGVSKLKSLTKLTYFTVQESNIKYHEVDEEIHNLPHLFRLSCEDMGDLPCM